MDAASVGAAAAGALAGAACAALALHGELARMREQLHPSERSVRRIVTANDASGRAVVLADSTAPCIFHPPMRDGVQVRSTQLPAQPLNPHPSPSVRRCPALLQVNNCWRVTEHPHVLRSGTALSALETAPAGERIPLLPPPDGSTFRVISFSPEAPWIEAVKRSKGNWLPLAAGRDGKPAPHPLMHRSETYAAQRTLPEPLHRPPPPPTPLSQRQASLRDLKLLASAASITA